MVRDRQENGDRQENRIGASTVFRRVASYDGNIESVATDLTQSPALKRRCLSVPSLNSQDLLLEQPKQEKEEEFRDQHPEMMSKVFVVNANNLERVVPNSGEYILENNFFTGKMFLMIRTPDVDNERSSKWGDYKPQTGSTAARVSEYFKDKKRQFEFQFQIKLKTLPTGKVHSFRSRVVAANNLLSNGYCSNAL